MEGMYWDDFRRMIERNKSDSAQFRYYKKGEKMTICDFGLPLRNGMVQTAKLGHSRADNWYQHSYACNVGYLHGYVPMFNNETIYNDETEEWEVHPVRGAMNALRILLGSGCLEKTDELTSLFTRYSGRPD